MVVFACGREFHVPVKILRVDDYVGNKIYYLQSKELSELCEKIFFCAPIALKFSKNVLGDTSIIVEYEDGYFRLIAHEDHADTL